MRFITLAAASLASVSLVSPAFSQSPTPQAAGSGATQAQFAITVLEPGAEPRREFRYDLEAGQTEAMVMRMAVDQSIAADGVMGREMTLPTMVMELDLETTELATGEGEKPEGTIEATFEFVSLSASDREGSPEGSAEMITEALGGYTTVSGGLTLEPTGRLTQLRIDANPETPPAVQQSLMQTVAALRNVFTPFPDEAVGVGAQWRIDMVIPFPSFTMAQRIEYTLEEIDGDVVTLSMEVSQGAPGEQTIEDTRGEWESEVAEISGGGEGSVVIDLKRLAPVESDLTISSRVVVNSTQGDRTAQTVVQSATRVATTGEKK